MPKRELHPEIGQPIPRLVILPNLFGQLFEELLVDVQLPRQALD
jgi:hypothetical protein